MHTVGLKSDDTVVAAVDIHLGQWDGDNWDLNWTLSHNRPNWRFVVSWLLVRPGGQNLMKNSPNKGALSSGYQWLLGKMFRTYAKWLFRNPPDCCAGRANR